MTAPEKQLKEEKLKGEKTREERPGRVFERPAAEFEQKMLDLRRVTRVVAGGKRFNFSALLAIGDKKGRVGLGLGKAIDTQASLVKAFRSAKKHLIKIPLTKENSLPFDVSAKYGSARVMLRPNRGRGIVAGSVVRDILVLAGVKDVTSKIIAGTKNKLNISKATMAALQGLFI